MATKPIDEGAAYTVAKKGIPKRPVAGRVAKKPMPARSNKGGAVRGQARAAQVQAMKKGTPKSGTPVRPISDSAPAKKAALPARAAAARKLPGPTPTTSATNPPPAAIRKAAASRVASGTAPMPAWKAATINPPPKSGVPPRPIGDGMPSPMVSPRNTSALPAWAQRPRTQVKRAG
jgi:hypothetical protein